MMSKAISFEQARRQFVHRFTMEYIPDWAKDISQNTGEVSPQYYAPQYKSDKEWYDNTEFYPDSMMATKMYCYSTNHSFPMGKWLNKPYTIQA